MSHFYGKTWGKPQSIATRTGHKATGLTTQAASYAGAIEVELFHVPETGKDIFIVRQIPWQGVGAYEQIAKGVLGQLVDVKV